MLSNAIPKTSLLNLSYIQTELPKYTHAYISTLEVNPVILIMTAQSGGVTPFTGAFTSDS